MAQVNTQAEALKGAAIAGVIALVLLVIIDGILNIVFGDPFFSMPGVSTMIVDAVIVVWCAWSGYRNVMNGGTWYAPKK